MFERKKPNPKLQAKIKSCILKQPSIKASSVNKLNFIKALAILDNANIKTVIK